MINIVYFGSPELSANILQDLIDNKDINVTLVITQEDKPVGREKIITPTPVKQLALKNNLPVFDGKIKTLLDSDKYLSILKSANFGLVFAYGKILPSSLLETISGGFWNIHPSLLPELRGASPIAYSLLLGHKIGGVCLIKMDNEMDHGDIFAQQEIPILIKTTKAEFEENILHYAKLILRHFITKISKQDNFELIQQDNLKRTYTKILTKDDGYIDQDLLQKSLSGELISFADLPKIIKEYYEVNKKFEVKEFLASHIVWNMFRAFYPWPGLWTYINVGGLQKRLKITQCELKEDKILISEVQLEGKKPVSFSTFLMGYKDVFPTGLKLSNWLT